ncbi:hypothetical protein GGP41_009720 [Bipolaris sorokiniana]|uniref:Uncharacterized protein n=1 Tax=Cochliobolus sativus TaxID=45130 RepID=A0A8H5ZG46_COCSA|nr:hypothetical protein GGP41_009720 [Bipolaris sorokiniana]
MAQLQTLINNRIKEILESIKDIIKPNFKQLAREYGRLTRSKRLSDIYKLNKAQDCALYDYIARLNELSVYIRLPMIVSQNNGLNGNLSSMYDDSDLLILIARIVITFEPRRRIYLLTPNNRTLLTVTECVNAAGYAILLIIIIEGDALLKRYFTNLPNNYLIAHSDSSYINN